MSILTVIFTIKCKGDNYFRSWQREKGTISHGRHSHDALSKLLSFKKSALFIIVKLHNLTVLEIIKSEI